VVVAVAFVDTIFMDIQLRSGSWQDFFPIRPPYIPGGGVAGTVVGVGAGVDPAWVGRRVVALTKGVGAYAVEAVAELDQVVAVPEGLALQVAAALVHDGRTAYALAESIRVRPGEWVLVLAAAGGLGLLLVQLAQSAGAHVIGAARGTQKLAAIKAHGADLAVDYSDAGWIDQVTAATGTPGPAVVFDGAGGSIGGEALQLTAPGGRFSAHGAPSGAFTDVDIDWVRQRRLTFKGIEQTQLATDHGNRVTAHALADAAAGRIRPLIGLTLPLEKAGEAHAAIEARAVVGKTLLVP
jgi:NADPH2:quinone reductase